MNIQNVMKQAKQMQTEMMKVKKEIDEKIFVEKASIVAIEVRGTKEIEKIEIDNSVIKTKEDIEMLEDILLITLNKVFKQIDDETNKKMSKYGPGLSGLM